jgi:hypothetical protein
LLPHTGSFLRFIIIPLNSGNAVSDYGDYEEIYASRISSNNRSNKALQSDEEADDFSYSHSTLKRSSVKCKHSIKLFYTIIFVHVYRILYYHIKFRKCCLWWCWWLWRPWGVFLRIKHVLGPPVHSPGNERSGKVSLSQQSWS